MADRKKLELQLNVPYLIELLFDNPTVGNSQYGEYYLYGIRNGDGTSEYNFFAPAEVHEKMKVLKKGDKVLLTKLAEQKGSKIITKYDVQVQTPEKIISPNDTLQSSRDNYFEAMLSSYEDAIKIQEKLNGMVDVNRIAITLFIARSKLNQNSYGG